MNPTQIEQMYQIAKDQYAAIGVDIELLESSVQSMLAGMAIGKLKELDKKAVQDLGNVMTERDLPLFGAPGQYDSLEDMYFKNG